MSKVPHLRQQRCQLLNWLIYIAPFQALALGLIDITLSNWQDLLGYLRTAVKRL